MSLLQAGRTWPACLLSALDLLLNRLALFVKVVCCASERVLVSLCSSIATRLCFGTDTSDALNCCRLLVSPDMTGPVITAYYAAACQSSSPTLLQHVTCDLDAAAGATNKPASSLMLGSSDICSWQTWRVVDLAISSITESQEISTGAHDRRQSSASFTSGITTPEIGRAGSAGAAASCGGQGQDEQQQQPAEAQEQGDIRQGSQQQSGSDGTPGAVGGNRASDSEHCNQGAGQELEGEVISTTATEGKLGCLKSVQLGRPLHVSLRDPMIQQLWRDAKHNVRQDVAVVLTGFDWLNSTPTDMG